MTGCCLLWLALSRSLGFTTPATNTLKFDFQSGQVVVGHVQVLPTTIYSPDLGYGFEPGSRISALENGGCTSEWPFLFSVRLPEGNYEVKLTFGDSAVGSTNTVKAESRRLMLEEVITAPGQFKTASFAVNIRTPQLASGGSVRLKDREKNVLHWDDKLTLEFNGLRPAVRELDIAPATNAVTVFLLGDSTVTDQPQEPWNSWGQILPRFFTPAVAVANHAESGESLKSSLHARRVEKVLTSLKPGDYVFVQFGHNDQKDHATNALAVFKSNLKQLVADVRARQATPVLITSMERMAGVEKDTLGVYPATVSDVAREETVALIDLHAMSRTLYRALGPQLKQAFQDGTHHNAYGSYELAKCIVQGIRQAQLGLSHFIVADLPAFDPAHPDPVDQFHVPASASSSSLKPDGS
jgi:lysophospholipase L1-like esterase